MCKANAKCGGCLKKVQKKAVDAAKQMCGDNCEYLTQLKEMLSFLAKAPLRVLTFCGGRTEGGVGPTLPPYLDMELEILVWGHYSLQQCKLDTGNINKSMQDMGKCVWPLLKALMKGLKKMGTDKCACPLLSDEQLTLRASQVQDELYGNCTASK